jgi:hypothetical protein
MRLGDLFVVYILAALKIGGFALCRARRWHIVNPNLARSSGWGNRRTEKIGLPRITLLGFTHLLAYEAAEGRP